MKLISGLCKRYPYRFRPKLVPSLAALLLFPILVSLGQWQAHRAAQKKLLQNIYNKRELATPVLIGSQPLDLETTRYSKVLARGRYEPTYQILLDNQIYQGAAGYQVVTPLHIEGSEMRVLVYRGWVAMGRDRRVPPVIETPQDVVEVSGIADEPSGKYMELGQGVNSGKSWQAVWQNLDIKRYKKAVPFPVQTLVILLDPASSAGGYVRDWPHPDARVDMHRGYAFQWYALALMLALYYLFANLEKIRPEGQDLAQ